MSAAIERARKDDAAAIVQVHVASLRASYRSQFPDHAIRRILDPPDPTPQASGWRGWLGRSQADTFVARADGTVVGFCTLQPIASAAGHATTGEIVAVYVLPSHWRRGIGRRLCDRTLAEAHARGLTEVELWVLESNRRAQRFYESLGFRPDGRKRVFLEHSGALWHDLRYRRSGSG